MMKEYKVILDQNSVQRLSNNTTVCNPSRIQKFYRFLFVCLVTTSCGCAVKTVKTVEIAHFPGFAQKTLIATRDSEFKNAVVSKTSDLLSKEVAYLKIIDIKRLQDESTFDYDAVVIIDACMAWSLSGSVKSFLAGIEERQKIILLATANVGKWNPELYQIDSITSASEMCSVDEIAVTIVEKLRRLFQVDQ